jgi:hypothetical protein
LKTLEKINRKAIKNSLENGKAISAQVGPSGLAPRACASAPARPRSLTSGPHLSAPTLAPLLSLSPSRCSVGPTCQHRFFSHVLALSLPRGPHPSAVPNLSPTSPPWTRPRPRVLRSPLHALAPLDPAPRSPISPAHLCLQSSSLVPLSPCACSQTSSASVHRRPPPFRDRR